MKIVLHYSYFLKRLTQILLSNRYDKALFDQSTTIILSRDLLLSSIVMSLRGPLGYNDLLILENDISKAFF